MKNVLSGCEISVTTEYSRGNKVTFAAPLSGNVQMFRRDLAVREALLSCARNSERSKTARNFRRLELMPRQEGRNPQ